MPFNDEAQELLRQAATIEAAPSGSGKLEAAEQAGRGVAGGGGSGDTTVDGVQGGPLGAGEQAHDRKGHPQRSFPQ